MCILLAAVSDKATDPQTWSEAIARNGFAVVVAAVVIGAALLLGGFLVYRLFGPAGFVEKIMTRWGDHLDRSEKIQSAQWALCTQVHRPGGTANLADFRDAGHDLMDVLQEIGNGVKPETGVAIKPKIDKIHEKLRQSPPPLPVLDFPQAATPQ